MSTTIPFALWLAVSSRLPHSGVGWKHPVPGALLVGIGAQAVQQLAAWFLAPALASATQLYGLLGIVATALFGFYLLARLIVVAPTLNASVGEERSAAARHPDGRTNP